MTPPREPPPWWPEGEAWPPDDWRMARRQFVPRFAALMLGLTLLFLMSCMLVFAIYWNGWRRRRPGRRRQSRLIIPLGGAFVLLMLAYIGTQGFRSLRANALALDDVARGVDQIAAGDYDVRVVEQGWPETRELSRSVTTMATRLRAAEAQRIELQADIAHELRTPLSVIQGTAEGMIDGVYARDDEHLNLILRRSRMMAELLEDFRTFATAEAGALQLHRERVDVSALLEEIAADFRDEAQGNDVSIEHTGDTGLLADVDPVRLTEIIENLVSNALRHTAGGDQIELDAKSQGRDVMICVRDSGEGIPADRLGTVFDRYAKSADSGGSGLGLAIAKRLVEAHGGSISVESVVGQGATFTIRLPQ